MKCTSTPPGKLKKSFLVFLSIILAITLINLKSYAQSQQRVYATTADDGTFGVCLLCSVSAPGQAVDNNVNTASTVTAGVSLLGGGIYQNLIFPAGNLPGNNTGVVVKVSTGTTLSLSVLGAIKVQAYFNNTPVGVVRDGGTALLNLLANGNQAEIFVPGPGVPYNRVRVTVDGGALAALTSINVFHAYYLQNTTNINCDAPIDELHGISGTVGALGGVNNAANAIDGVESTYATLGSALGLVGFAQETVVFPGLSAATDSVRMLVSSGPTLLSLELLGSVSIETFNGNVSNGLVPGTGGLLKLRLLSPGSSIGVLSFAPGVPFDRVQLRIGGVASLLNSINLHEVSRSMALPTIININSTASATGIACTGDGVVLNINSPEVGAIYTWYTQATGGTGVTGTSYTPTGLTTGVNNFYVSGKRNGCTNESPRKLVSITVNNPILPVVSTVTPICSGSKATLQIGAPVVGETYRWYDAAVGGTLVFTGETFLTPILAANTSYYVESVIGACSSARQQVDVTVNPLPADAQVSSTNVNISTGQTATLTATAPTAGSTINWYTVATGGSPVATGTSFTTPALTVNTTYYVGTQSAGGCLSQNRVAVNVIVTNVTPGVTCKSANAQSNGIQGICIGCEVSDPNFSVDADPLNFSSIRLAVGVLGVGYQKLIFPTAGVLTDSIRLDLRLPGNIVDLSLLGGISVNVKNGNATVASYDLNSALIHLTLLGGDRFKVTVPAGGAYDAVEVRFGAVLSAVTALDIFGAEVIYPKPTVAAAGLNICSGASTTLTATPNGGTDLKWYADATGGVALATGNTFSPANLTATTTYYIEVGKGSCVNTERVPVTVNVNPAIVFATAPLSNATLASAYSKQIPVATGGTPAFNYTLAPGSTLPAGLTLSATGLISGTPTAVEGPYTFSVLATDSKGCTATAAYNLNVTAGLSLPAATLPNGTVNTVYPTQTLPAATGGTGPFTYVATNLPPGLTFDPVTREITGTPTQAGTYPVHVTVTDVNGNTKTADYTIIVRDPLALPTATLANGTVGIPYPTQAIPAATGGIGPFTYSAPAASLPPGLIFDPVTREITGTPTLAGTYTIPVTVTDGDGKTTTRDYTIVVGSPLVLPPATLADGNVNVGYTSQPIPSATGGTGPYTYAATNLPPGLTFDPATRVISGTPTQSGLYSVSVTVTDNTGTTATNTYPLRVIGALNLPTMVLADGTVGTVYTEQTLPEVTGGTGPYTYTSADLPPGLNFDPVTRKLTGTPTQGGTFTFSITAKDAANNSTTTAFTVKVKVDAPVAASVSICSGSTATLSVSNTLPGVTYNWYASTGNTPVFTGATYTTAALSSNTTYYVEAVSGTATSSRTAVTVTARPTPALAVVSAGQSISAGQTATLTASAEAGNTINWFTTPTGGTAVGTGTSFTTPALNTTTTYYAETANSTGCVSATRVAVVVTVTSGPVNPNCNAATAQVTKIESLLCLLCGITDPAGSTDADPATFTTINLGVNVAGVAYQKLIFPNQGAATDSIRLDFETPVGLADIGLINGGTITVYNGNTVVKVYPLSSPLLNLQLLSGNRILVTVPATGAFNAVEIRVGAVANLLSRYNIYGASIIYPNPTVAATGQTICAGNTTTLTATANGGTTLKWYDSATSGTVLGTGETFTTPALTATTTYYIEVSKAGCANTVRVPVKVTVTAAPTAPVLATVLPVCYGSTASLAVNAPGAGVSYKWYTVSTGGTSIFTGSTFVTPALTANTTYYVEASNPGCGTSTRTAVPVTVNPIVTLPQIQASATTVGSGQTVTLNATSPDANVTFNWFDSATATTPKFTGATYVTEPLTATTTYYLEAKSNATGCTSVSRVQVTITVDNSLPSPVPCQAAVSETHDVVGVALLSAIFNPQLAIDNDTRTGSSLVMPVGLLGAAVYQRLGFGSVSSIGDTVKVLLSAPGKLLSLGLLSSIQVGTYNGATSNNDAVSINNSLIHLELLSNNSQALISFVPTAAFDQVEVRLNSGLAGVLSTVDVNYGRRVLVAPALTAANPTICATQTATLTVQNPNAALTYKWYDSRLPAAVALATGTSFTTPALNATTNYYVEASSTSGCASYRTQVTVTVTPAPAVPELVTANINTCVGTTVTLAVKNPLAGITYKWYDATGVTELATGTTFTTPAIAASINYQVAAVSTACNVPSASKALAQITATGLDSPVITPTSATVRSGSAAALTASSSTAGVIFKWYDSQAPGATPVFTGANFVTGPLTNTGATPIVFTYYVSGEIAGGCTSTTLTTTTITVLPAVNPNNDLPCEVATIQKRAGVDGVALLGGVFNPGLATDLSSTTASSLVIPVGLLGASAYQHIGFTGLSVVGDTVRIGITSPGKLLTLAVLPSIEITTYKDLVSNGDMMVLSNSNPLIKLELFSDNSGGVISFVPSKQFDGVELRLRSGLASVLSTLDFNYARRSLVVPTVLSANVSACLGTAATLSVQNPIAGTTYTWYKGTAPASVGTGTTFATETTLTAGTYDYYVTADRNGCASAKTKVTVTILAAPDAPVELAGNPKTTCPNVSVSLGVTPVAGISFNWFDALTGGNNLATNTSTYTTAANLTPGVYNFYVEASNANSCTSTAARTKITLTVNPPATPADITVTGADAPLCKDTKATLTASSTTVTAPVFTWYRDAALTDLAFTGPLYEPVITASTTFYVSVNGTNVCASTPANAKVVTITVNPPAIASDITVTGAGAPLCKGSKATLTASSTTVTNPKFTWYADAALTTVLASTAIYEPTLTATTTFYATVSGDNKCPNLPADAKAVTVTVNTPGTAADIAVAGNDAPFCLGTKASFKASTTTVTNPTFIWYTDAALTTEVFRGATFEPTLTASITYYVTVSGDNKCPNDPADAKVVAVVVNTPATAADITVAGNDVPFCKGTKAKFTASSTTVTAPVFTWYRDADLTDVAFTGPVFEPVLNANATYYVTVRGTNRCESLKAEAKVVTVVINPPAVSTDITVAGNNAPFCNGAKALLTASSTTVTSPVFTWYSDAALTTVVSTGPVFEPTLTATTTYYVTVSGTNKCANLSGDAKIVTLIVNTPSDASDVIVTGADLAVCAGATIKLTATSTTVTSPVFTWYTDAALSNAIFTGAVLERPVTAAVTYYVTVKGANKCENLAGTGKAVAVSVNPPATAADINVTGNQAAVCAGAKLTLTATAPTVTNPKFIWYSDASLTTEVFRGPIYEPTVTANTTYYVTVSGDNRCPNGPADAKVVAITTNTPATAADITVAGNDAPYCAGTKATLTAGTTTVTNPVFTWYSDADLTTVVANTAVFEPTLTSTTTFYVTVRGSNRCENLKAGAKAVTVVINPPALSTDITVTGNSNALCAGSKALLTASSTTVTSPVFTWYTNAALTNVAATGAIFEPTLTATTTFYVTVRGANRCENAAADAKVVTVTVNTPADASDVVVAGADVPVCAGTTVKLTASSTTVTNPVFTWYTDAALTNAVFTGAILEKVQNATITYYVTVKGDNKCESLPGTAKVITLTVNPLPDVPVIANANSLAVCSGDGITLNIQSPQAGVTFEWYNAATGGTLLGTGTSLPTGPLAIATDFYVLAKSASGCGSTTGRVKATVTVSPKPAVPTVTSATATACPGSTTVLSVSGPVPGITYSWYDVATGGTALGTGTNFTTPAITAGKTFYVGASTATCSSDSRTAVSVSVQVSPNAPTSVNGATDPICAGNTTVLSVNNPDAALTYRWYTSAAGGTSLSEGSSFTTPSLAATTTYYVEAVNKATGCSSATRTSVVVTILPKLTAPVVSVQAATATTVNFAWAAVAGAKGYEVSVDGGTNWIAPSSGAAGLTHLISGLKPDQAVTIRVRAVGQLPCQLSDAASLNSKAENPLGNQIFIPNTFTPNGDGKNDVLYVYGNTIAKLKLRVYNQWGQFIYESLNVQSGWDGTYKGEIQPNGVYVYIAEVEFNDGTKTSKKGTITLLR
ncbi:Ig-like domain-containing protein [Pedobacter caeni]|uniref:Gliding motility-associated C-terminal domain-containing protein n=1 Tax=Pedobacter caeni TaxID=288992 RepID=A0A1M5NL31_9SPHI|nr:putative Ig domain-containing protein [Pedobacter caeni]SHG90218.1 gliding motility-associated C-terminal domain-containing protein [Pedobacter caeni]